jgi:hypothetical protein
VVVVAVSDLLSSSLTLQAPTPSGPSVFFYRGDNIEPEGWRGEASPEDAGDADSDKHDQRSGAVSHEPHLLLSLAPSPPRFLPFKDLKIKNLAVAPQPTSFREHHSNCIMLNRQLLHLRPLKPLPYERHLLLYHECKLHA